MNQPFVPLSPAAAATPAPASGAPGAVPSPGPAPAFRPIREGPALCASSNHFPNEPKVTLERDGDRITLIRIQCACGQTVELACVY